MPRGQSSEKTDPGDDRLRGEDAVWNGARAGRGGERSEGNPNSAAALSDGGVRDLLAGAEERGRQRAEEVPHLLAALRGPREEEEQPTASRSSTRFQVEVAAVADKSGERRVRKLPAIPLSASCCVASMRKRWELSRCPPRVVLHRCARAGSYPAVCLVLCCIDVRELGAIPLSASCCAASVCESWELSCCLPRVVLHRCARAGTYPIVRLVLCCIHVRVTCMLIHVHYAEWKNKSFEF